MRAMAVTTAQKTRFVRLLVIVLLLAVAIGGGLFGVAGMLLMVPIVSVIYTLVIEVVRNRLREREIDEECLMPQPPVLQPHFVFTRKKKDKSNKKKTDNE